MKVVAVMALASATAAALAAQDKVNRDAAILQDFNARITEYVKLHNIARSEVHGLKPTPSQAKIDEYEHRLAHRIRESREGIGAGNIFTAPIAAEFRRLIGLTMQGSEGPGIRASLQRGSPVHLKAIRVNRAYPDGVALSTTPPSLLLNLPALPKELEYRVVGRALILRDKDANLIVDYIPNAIS